MNLLERIRRILGEPRDEWARIAAEPATVQSLYTNWIMILAAIGPVALLLSQDSLQFAIAQYVRALIMTFVLALVVDAVAPSFGGTKDFVASLKLTAYSYTATWLAGIFNLLGTAPEHKRHLVFESGHVIPINPTNAEISAWLDRYLGPVK